MVRAITQRKEEKGDGEERDAASHYRPPPSKKLLFPTIPTALLDIHHTSPRSPTRPLLLSFFLTFLFFNLPLLQGEVPESYRNLRLMNEDTTLGYRSDTCVQSAGEFGVPAA